MSREIVPWPCPEGAQHFGCPTCGNLRTLRPPDPRMWAPADGSPPSDRPWCVHRGGNFSWWPAEAHPAAARASSDWTPMIVLEPAALGGVGWRTIAVDYHMEGWTAVAMDDDGEETTPRNERDRVIAFGAPSRALEALGKLLDDQADNEAERQYEQRLLANLG